MAEGGKRFQLIGLLIGLFLAAVDSTVVAVAMPTIVTSLQGLEIYSWAFTAYILTSTVTGPLWGRISDAYGRRIIYLGGVGVFLAASLLCGLSTDMLQLIVFRAVQGLGGGALLVLTFTLIGEMFTLRERAKATGYTSSVWALASIVGPPLGGFIVDSLGWRWIFFINLPTGLTALMITSRYIRDQVKSKTEVPVMSSLLFMAAISAFLVYLNEFQTLVASPMFAVIGLAALSLFLYSEKKSTTPFIPFHLFKDKLLRTGFLGNLLTGFIFFGVVAYVPLYFQWVVGLSATSSGTMMLPLLLAWVVSANIAARLLIKKGIRPPVMVSCIALLTGTLILTFFLNDFSSVMVGLALVGVGMGFTVPTFLISTQTLVPRTVLGTATSMLSFLRLVGGAISAAAMWVPLATTVKQIEEKVNAGVFLTMAEKDLLIGGLQQSMFMGLVAAAAVFILYLSIPNIRLSGEHSD